MRCFVPAFVLVPFFAAILAGAMELRGDEIQIDLLMDREPAEKPQQPQWQFDGSLVDLWKRALARPESELKRQAAHALIQAHQFGHVGMDAAVPELRDALQQDNVHAAARHTVARALIVLDDRMSAPLLFDVSQAAGKDLRQLIEPTLAAWNFAAIRPVWRQRLTTIKTPRRDLMLAIQGLARQRDPLSLEGLLKLALEGEIPGDVRLASARAAGQVAHQGLEDEAERLLARKNASSLERLCAISLIDLHRSPVAVRIQLVLAVDPEPAVAAAALRSLFAADPQLVLPVAEAAMKNGDANVRQVGIDTYLQLPTPERIQFVSQHLSDPHPALRRTVRDTFFVLSRNTELDRSIRASSMAILAGDDWRGQEQGAILLAALGEKQVAGRLVELLESTRPEVMVMSAWALKTLAIPETATKSQDYAVRVSARTLNETHTDRQVAHLFELLGVLKATSAIPLLETFVPKETAAGPDTRAAAIWSLGLIQEGQTNEKLSVQLLQRAMDTITNPPEHDTVRRAAVLSLGRLRAAPQVRGLKQLVNNKITNTTMDLTVRWAISEITGEKLPIEPLPSVERSGWFLESTRKPPPTP